MKKGKKVFRNKKLKQLILARRLSWLIIPAVMILYGIFSAGSTVRALVEDPSLGTVGGLVSAMVIFGLLFGTILLFIIRKYLHYAIRQVLKNSSFVTTRDFEYYRDKMEELSPGIMSLLADLAVEPDKDISASLLQYENMGILRQVSGGAYEITQKYQQADLRDSDRFLIEQITAGTFHGQTVKHWVGLVETEAVKEGYLRDRQKKEGGMAGCGGCLVTFLLFIVSAFAFSWYGNDEFFALVEQMEQMRAAWMTEGQQFQLLVGHPEILLLLLWVIVFCLVGLRLVFYPVMLAMGVAGWKSQYSRFVRTEKGEEMAEYVFGMQNFIHDFSNLSMVDKEQLVLWNDYLVYAVTLEENQQIVHEIMSLMKKEKGIER